MFNVRRAARAALEAPCAIVERKTGAIRVASSIWPDWRDGTAAWQQKLVTSLSHKAEMVNFNSCVINLSVPGTLRQTPPSMLALLRNSKLAY